MSRTKTAGLPQDRAWVTAAEWFAGGQRIWYDPGSARVLTGEEAALVITDDDCRWIEKSFDEVIAGSHKVPGAIWSLGKTLVDNAVRKTA